MDIINIDISDKLSFCKDRNLDHDLRKNDSLELVKRRWSYKVGRTVYILTLSEFARHEFTNLWLETLPDTLSLSLTGIRLGPKQARRMNNSTASLSQAERWTITEIRWPSNWLIPCSQMSFCYKV